MKKSLVITTAFLGILSLLPPAASAQLSNYLDYMYLTNDEHTMFGYIIWFWTPDTVYGNVHSNSAIGIKYAPQFHGHVSTTEDDFVHGAGYSPWFAYPPQFNAPEVYFPTIHDWMIIAAQAQGHHYSADDGLLRQYQCKATMDGWHITGYPLGTPPDSANMELEDWVPYSPNVALSFEGDLYIEGEHILGGTGIHTYRDVFITDNLVYDGVPTNGFQNNLSDTITSRLGIIAAGDIRIADTWANGRGNGLYRSGGNFDSSHVIVTSALVALGESFTFEHHNDTWESYRWCDPQGMHPGQSDERGTINLIGNLVQMRRGYTHRSTCGGTGYATRYQYDARFLTNPPPHMYPNTFWGREHTLTDTTLFLSNQLYFRNTLILGPGTEIHVSGDLRSLCALSDSMKLFINGTSDNPVRIFLDEESLPEFTLYEESLGTDGHGVISDSTWSGLVIESSGNTWINLKIPHTLQDVQINAPRVTMQPHEALEIDTLNPMLINGFMFTGTILEVFNPGGHNLELKNAEIHGTLRNSCQRIERATFIGTSDFAIQNLNPDLTVLNTFFQGYEEALISQSSGSIDYSGYHGFSGHNPFWQQIAVGEHMLEDVEPRFVDPENGDYHLHGNSPLIDAGDPGSARDPDGSIADIGAYYFDQLAVDDHDAPQQAIPSSFGIASVFPNPFNPVTQVDISLPQADHVMVEVLDILGRRVALLQDGLMQAGTHSLTFNGAELASGTYFVRLSGHQATDVSKILLLK